MLQMRGRDMAERLWAFRPSFSNSQIEGTVVVDRRGSDFSLRYFFILTRFLHANRHPPRIKCGAGLRCKTR
jgi:hypothetical protein